MLITAAYPEQGDVCPACGHVPNCHLSVSSLSYCSIYHYFSKTQTFNGCLITFSFRFHSPHPPPRFSTQLTVFWVSKVGGSLLSTPPGGSFVRGVLAPFLLYPLYAFVCQISNSHIKVISYLLKFIMMVPQVQLFVSSSPKI